MCNYNIGYIDDDSSSLDDYSELLEKYVNLKFVENCKTIHDVYLWILNNKIECFVADFKLSDRYTFSGTELIEYLNKKIPDLVCVILTNYPCDSIAENIVSSILIRDRNSLNKLEDFENFCSELRQASQVFHKRLNNIETSFSVLLEKKRVKSITADEEETFISLYSLLKAYNKIDDLPNEIFKSEISEKIDKILEIASKCLPAEDNDGKNPWE